MLLYWYHFVYNGKRIEVETDDDSIGGHFLHLLHGEKPRDSWVRAMHTSLILYAEHEFNASTFTSRVVAGTGSDMYSHCAVALVPCVAPSTAAQTKSLSKSRSATTILMRPRPTSVPVWSKEVVIGFGHPVHRERPRNVVIKRWRRPVRTVEHEDASTSPSDWNR